MNGIENGLEKQKKMKQEGGEKEHYITTYSLIKYEGPL